MNKSQAREDIERVDRAFNRVLAAEAEARARVEACRQEAAAITEQATLRARAIAELADRRMGLAHRIADRGVERALAQLKDASDAGTFERDLATEPERLAKVVDALVDEILGGMTGVA